MTNEANASLPPGSGEIDTNKPSATFESLGLRPEVILSITNMGFTEPMEVQAATIPVARRGKDMLVQSRTGSGKTAAYAIPFVDWIADPASPTVQALVLLPTRELALQVAAETTRISANSGLNVVPIYGGAPMGKQVEQLKNGGHIVCGTPGRILDHLRRGTLTLDSVKCVVLDECDEMLSMGFQEDIENILSNTPDTRQTMLFSATIPEGIQRLSRRFLKSPEHLKLSVDFIGVHEIQHVYYSITGHNREAELLRVISFEAPERAVIFCNTREETTRVADFLRRQGIDADAISSDLSQTDRESVMKRMRAGQTRFLVATDVAARGIDIENLPCVINFSFPESPEIYIHRTGRTGRAGKSGRAISLIGPTEVGSFYYLKLLYKIKPLERSLPSEIEIRSKREGEKVISLRNSFGGEPGAEWLSLARRIMSAFDGERLIAHLLKERLASTASAALPIPSEEPVPAPITPPVTESAPQAPAPGPRFSTPSARPRFSNEAGRQPNQRRQRTERTPRPEGSPPKAPHPRRAAEEEKEFWEVWSEEVGRTPTPELAAEPSAPSTPPSPTTTPAPVVPREAADGSVRLYVNIGRKDRVSVDEVAAHLSAPGRTIAPDMIEMMNTHCYLNVPAAVASELCANASTTTLAGRRVLCEPARPPRRR